MKSLKKLVLVALVIVSGSSFAQAWKSSEWVASVIADKGGKTGDDKSVGAKLEVNLHDDDTITAEFITDNTSETWAFTDNSYIWNDSLIEVTSAKIDLASLKVPGLIGQEGVTNTAIIYGLPTCKVVSNDGDCTLPDNIAWGFNTVEGKNYFFYGYTKADGSSRFIIFKQY